MAAPRERLLAWPGVESLKLTLPLSYLFSKIFFSIYGGTSLLAGLRRVRPDFHFAWELRLPFIPWLAIVYLSVPLLLLLTPFILRTWRSFTPFFMHGHHVLDLVSGAVLGLAGVATVWRWSSREEVLESLRIEALCLREFAGFVRRHPRYLLVFFALFRASVPRWRRTRVLRAAYCLAQHVDDVLDGDRQIKGDPEEYTLAVIRGLRGEAPFGTTAAEQLAAFVAGELGRFESERNDPRDHPRSDLVKLFEVLIEDRRRMDARRTLSAEALAVQDWLRAEHRRAAAAIQALGNRLDGIAEPKGRAILSRLHQALALYERKYRRRHPDDEPDPKTQRAEPLPEASNS